MKTFTKTIRIAFASAILVTLSACGHSAPSESDAKAAIEAQLGDCEYFKVTDFTKINGRQLDDTDYKVQVKYTVEVDPGKYSDKLRDFQKAFDQMKNLRTQYGERMNALNAAYHGQQASGDVPSDITNNDPELIKLKVQSLDIANQIKSDNNNGMSTFVTAIRQECPNMRVAPSFMATFFNADTDLNQLADGEKAEFNDEFWMVKTDNGWQAAAQ